MKWSQLLNPPKGVGRLSLLAGYVAGEVCSLYGIFIAHTMNPVSYRMVENDLDLRAIRQVSGNLQSGWTGIHPDNVVRRVRDSTMRRTRNRLDDQRGIVNTLTRDPCRNRVSRTRYRSLSLLTNRIPDAAIEWPSSTSVRCLR